MDHLIERAATIVVLLSAIPLAAVALGGGLVALLQTITQVQEQSIVHLTKLGIAGALVLWGGEVALEEVQRLFLSAIALAGQGIGRGP